MTKTVILTDLAYDALCMFFSSPSNLSPSVLEECRLAFKSAPPVPPVTIPAQPVTTPTASPDPVSLLNSIPKKIAGYSKVMRYVWEWNNDRGGGLMVQTYDDKQQGPLGQGGLIVVAFVPLVTKPNSLGSISIAPYPGNVSGKIREVAISMYPGDFNVQFPAYRKGMDASIQFQVGGASRTNVILTPGLAYYLNVKSHDMPDDPSELRMQCSRPMM